MARTIIALAGALALAVTLPAVSAQAQAPRTFVSAAGSDSNPCSFAAPCRHFQAAVNATSAGGEVDALDPAGYGPITISQAITIEGQGWSYIAPPAFGNGITIAIPGGTGDVTIHGVSLNGVGISDSRGIQFNAGGSLTIVDCVIRNMSFDGISFFISQTSTAALTVSNSFFYGNNGNGIKLLQGGSGAVTTSIDRTVISHNGNIGLNVQSGNIAVTDSVAANNGSAGFSVTGIGSSLSLTRVKAVGNNIGVQADAGMLWLAQSTITGNAFGIDAESGGTINSYADNYLSNNTSFAQHGILTSVGKQ
jgi:hypothetical protein